MLVAACTAGAQVSKHHFHRNTELDQPGLASQGDSRMYWIKTELD
jgi:hypothetical protein